MSSVASLVAAAIEVAASPSAAGVPDRALVPALKALAACPGLLAFAERMKRISQQVRDQAVSQERHRIALEIHDSMAQAFTGIALQLEAAERIAADPSPQLLSHLQRARALAREAIGDARRIIWALKPSVLENTNLTGGLKLLARRIFAGTPIHVRFRCRGKPHSLDVDTELELLRIAQEAMNNVLKHSGAGTLQIDLKSTNRNLEIRIIDDGCGFDLEAARAKPGLGLKAMQDRASRAGARVEIHSLRGKGTRVVTTRPVGLPVHDKGQISAHSFDR